MGLKTKKILGIDVTISQIDEDLEEIRKYLELRHKIQDTRYKKKIKPLVIFTPNPEIVTYAQKDEYFKQIVNTAQINLPDGAGVVWAVRKLYGIKVDKIPGVGFMLELVKLAGKEGFRIGLIGGRGDLAVDTAECLLKSYPDLKIEVFDEPEIEVSRITYHVSRINKNNIRNTKYIILNTQEKQDGNTDIYFETLAKDLITKKINILFVALGFPKQEYFIDAVRQQLSIINYQLPIILMAVGGAFDYISGRVPRAPQWMRNMGLEWLYRLIQEPWRLPRQLKGAEFFLRVVNSTPGVERGQKVSSFSCVLHFPPSFL